MAFALNNGGIRSVLQCIKTPKYIDIKATLMYMNFNIIYDLIDKCSR